MRDHQFELFAQGRAVAAAMSAVQVFGRREAKVLASSMDRRGDLISGIMAGLNIDRLKPRCKSEKFWPLLVQSCVEHRGSVCQDCMRNHIAARGPMPRCLMPSCAHELIDQDLRCVFWLMRIPRRWSLLVTACHDRKERLSKECNIDTAISHEIERRRQHPNPTQTLTGPLNRCS